MDPPMASPEKKVATSLALATITRLVEATM
jgi:hypothetical protein